MAPRCHLAFLLVGGLAFSGCATRYNPLPLYPDPMRATANEALFAPPAFFKPGEPDIQSGTMPTYQQAVEYAQALARAYRHAQAADAASTDALSVLLLGTGSAGIGLGLAGITGNPFIALGTATGAGVGYGTWFRNPQRRDAFAIGEQALHCVIRETMPIGLFLARKNGISQAVKPLGEAIQELSRRLSSLGVEWAAVPADRRQAEKDLAARIDTVLRIGGDAVGQAEGVRVAALGIVDTLDAGGPRTFGTVEVIRGHVTTAAVRGQADIATLPGILRSAVQGGYKDIFGALAEEQAKKAKDKADQAQGQTAPVQKAIIEARTKSRSAGEDGLGKVESAVVEVERSLTIVASALERVRLVIADVNIANVGAAVAQCIDPVALAAIRRPNPVVVTPSTVQIVVGKNDKVMATGGLVATPEEYRLEKLWGAEVKIDVKEATVGSARQYTISVDEDTKPGSYHMIVRDIVGTSQAVRIEVTPNPDKPK